VNGLGKPAVGFHFLAGGPVVGDYSTVSVTEGFAKRFEVGYTSEIHAGSNRLPVSGVFPSSEEAYYIGTSSQDFSIVHGKAVVIPENAFKTKWVPAVAIGGIFRFNDHNAFDGATAYITSNFVEADNTAQNTRNGDIYIVATKVITQISKKVPVLISGGLRGTDASLWGLGGNAPGFSARGFGAAALIFTGPGKSNIIVGSEIAQQPQKIKIGLYSALDVPTSESYAVRFVPSPKHKVNFDAGILHAGGNIGGLKLNARARVAFGVSYGF
jgi:hypothetical protein